MTSSSYNPYRPQQGALQQQQQGRGPYFGPPGPIIQPPPPAGSAAAAQQWAQQNGWNPGTTLPYWTTQVQQQMSTPTVPLSESLGAGVTPIPKVANGGLLRYPYEALTESTDYLQIDIRSYNPIGKSLISSPGTRINASPNEVNISAESRKSVSIKKLTRGQGTIILPMPSNIQDGNSVTFSSGNLDGITAQVFEGVSKLQTTVGNNITQVLENFSKEAKSIGHDLLQNQAFKNTILADLAAQAANIPIGGSLTRDAVFARAQGQILNQNVELLFNGVTLRSFKFSFKMTPRNENEAQQIKLIINAFKQNMAAKVANDKSFLGTPNVFELTYKQGPRKHPFLHSFKQCVLENMSVNYTGEGVYSTYAGEQGSPVSMVLELGFKELEPIYDTDYDKIPIGQGVGY